MESPAPEADALSIGPTGHHAQASMGNATRVAHMSDESRAIRAGMCMWRVDTDRPCVYKRSAASQANQVRGSIVASISACHADDPGSIPGRGVLTCVHVLYIDVAIQFLTRPGLEPGISGSGGRRLIHWANGPYTCWARIPIRRTC